MGASLLETVLSYATRSSGALGVYLLTFWKADDQLTEQGRKYLYESLSNMTGSVQAPFVVMDRYFHPGITFFKMLKNTLLFSVASLILLLALYMSLVPGFFNSIWNDEMSRAPFIRQIFTNGLPVVFIVNYVGFSLYLSSSRPGKFAGSAVRVLALDVFARMLLFCLLTAIVYLGSAHLFGSFSGDMWQAVRAVGPTITLAATFGNLSGVYVYAAAISAFPLFIAALIELMQASPGFSRFVRGIFFFLPFENKPIRSLAAILGVFFGLFALVISVFASLF